MANGSLQLSNWSGAARTASSLVLRTLLDQAATAGLMLTVLHSGFVLLATGRPDLPSAYAALLEWDAQWYASILDGGYACDVEQLGTWGYASNCGFFPGLPLLAAPLRYGLGLPAWLALPLTAQLCCWGFWTLLLLLLRRWEVRPDLQVATLATLLLHPWSFYLVTGYSEAPFLLFMLGYLYWSDRPTTGGFLAAALCGIGMTATRLVGVAVLPWPLLIAVFRDPSLLRRPARWLHVHRRSFLLAGIASLGLLGFDAFLWWRFGRFDLYHLCQRIGWDVHPDYLAPFKWRTYVPTRLNAVFPPLLILWTLYLFWREGRTASLDPQGAAVRRTLLTIGAFLLYLAVAAMYSRKMVSLPRISLPTFVLLLVVHVGQVGWLPRSIWNPRRRLLLGLALVAIVLACLLLQAHFVQRFTLRRWVS